MNHLAIVFDRGFDNGERQWPLAELEYQCRVILEILNNGKSWRGCTPAPSATIRSSNTSSEPFIRLAMVIESIKHEFEIRFGSVECVRWLNESHWSGDRKTVKNNDIMAIGQDHLEVRFQLTTECEINTMRLSVKIKTKDTIIIELPIGTHQTSTMNSDFGSIVNILMLEFRAFYAVFSSCKSK